MCKLKVNTLQLVQPTTIPAASQPALKEVVRKVVSRYLHDMGHSQSNHLHEAVLAEVEPALFQEVMQHCRGNQSRAAEILGLNRATLRKKLKQYNIKIV
jgi:Fis family transcriptional regulator